MRRGLRIFYSAIVIAGTCTFAASAAEITPFPTTPAVAAEARVNRFLDSGTQDTGRIAYLEAMEVQGLAAIDTILKVALARWEQEPLEPGIRQRIVRCLRVARRKAAFIQPSDSKLLAGIKEKADLLLLHYAARSQGQALLVSIFDSQHLWTASNFWFVLRYSKTSSDLLSSASRLRAIIPLLSPAQLNALAEVVREIRPYSLVQLSVLMDAGQLKESELVTLFKLASDRLANLNSPSLDGTVGRYLDEGLGDRVFAPSFTRILRALHSGEPAVVSAMMKARGYWERQVDSPNKDNHMRLFDSLGNENLDWMRPWNWLPKAFSGAQPDAAVEDNVILVNFKLGRSCNEDLQE